MSTVAGTLPCVSLNCDFPRDVDLYSLDGLDFFTSNRLSFVLECPPGYFCPNFPVPWNVPPGYLPPIILPNITGRSQKINIRVQCCDNSYVTAVVTVNVTQGVLGSGNVSGTISTSTAGVSGTVTIIGNVPVATAQLAVKYVVQGVVAKLQLECAKKKAACQEEKDDHIFPPGDPRNPIRSPVGGRILLSALSNNAGCVNSAFQSNLAANSRFAPVNFYLFSGTMPPGLSIRAIGLRAAVISGTPTAAGSYTFTIQAQDPIATLTRRQYTICIVGIAPPTLPDGTVGVAYVQNFLATACATPPLSWQVFSGTLPTGLTLDEETGILSGTPSGSGTFNFTILLQTEAT